MTVGYPRSIITLKRFIYRLVVTGCIRWVPTISCCLTKVLMVILPCLWKWKINRYPKCYSRNQNKKHGTGHQSKRKGNAFTIRKDKEIIKKLNRFFRRFVNMAVSCWFCVSLFYCYTLNRFYPQLQSKLRTLWKTSLNPDGLTSSCSYQFHLVTNLCLKHSPYAFFCDSNLGTFETLDGCSDPFYLKTGTL